MGTVTRDEALLAYAYCMLLLQRTKRKHLKAPKYVLQYIQEKINPHWEHLNYSERTAFMFAVSERKYLDTRYVGPVWKLAVATFWLKNNFSGLAADFIIDSDNRLN